MFPARLGKIYEKENKIHLSGPHSALAVELRVPFYIPMRWFRQLGR
jgi:hypothetical protein